MPESTELTDEVFENRVQDCLEGSTGLETVQLVNGQTCNLWTGFRGSSGISEASGIRHKPYFASVRPFLAKERIDHLKHPVAEVLLYRVY